MPICSITSKTPWRSSAFRSLISRVHARTRWCWSRCCSTCSTASATVVTASAEAGQLTLCVMDEAWRFIQHDRLRAYVQEALKTWRKRNGAMLLATQSIDDFASADLLRTVVESCPTKLLLANPSFDRAQYAELFQLNDTELDLLEALTPRRQLLLKRPGLWKVLTLNIDQRSYWLYTDTPIDNERVTTMFREHGFEAGLDRLAASA